jgi:[acyl-carrier-protein] S-malonyltransferase
MPKVAFLFPGQGAQTVGMAQVLATKYASVRKLYDDASAVLGFDLAAVSWQGPKEKLDTTVISQPAILVASLAALEAAREQQPQAFADCTACAGLSLGEYTALVFAGALSFADAVGLVKIRGEAMQAAADVTPSGMLAVLGPEAPQVAALCDQARESDVLQVANYLCPGNTVASGSRAAIDRLEKIAETSGAKTIRLPVAGAFHTSLMKPADDKLKAALANVIIQPPRVPVWSNVDAKPHTDPDEIRGLLVRQVVEPVRMEDSLRGLLAAGCEKFVEVGPGRVLAGLLKRVNRKIECVNVSA